MKTFINYLNESINPNEMTEEEQIEFVQKKWDNIKNIDNPSLKVQFAAVNEYEMSIYYIKNPSKEVQFVAVKKQLSALIFIDNSDEEVNEYVGENINFNELLYNYGDEYINDNIFGKVKKYINNEEDINLIKKYPFSIAWMNNPSEEAKKIAIDNISPDKLIELPNINIEFQQKVKNYITKEIYYKMPKDFPWIPEIKEKFKNIDRFKRFNL